MRRLGIGISVLAGVAVLAVAPGARGDVGARHMPWPAPVVWPEPGWVWVPPVYETIRERVWIGERTERVCDRVWVAPRYELRPVYDEHGHLLHYVRELVSGGYYETQWRDVVVPAHWETVEKRVLVVAGHWEPGPRPVPLPRPMPWPEPVHVSGVPTVGVEGYARAPETAEKGVFSPTWEWPK